MSTSHKWSYYSWVNFYFSEIDTSGTNQCESWRCWSTWSHDLTTYQTPRAHWLPPLGLLLFVVQTNTLYMYAQTHTQDVDGNTKIKPAKLNFLCIVGWSAKFSHHEKYPLYGICIGVELFGARKGKFTRYFKSALFKQRPLSPSRYPAGNRPSTL